MSVNIKITDKADVETARGLFFEYAGSLNFSLCFQNFDKELESLPGDYAPPSGRILIAYCDNNPAGCVALRKIGDGVCEMKRLYVKNDYRGLKLGKRLVEEIISEGRKAGYRKMRLDTVPSMTAARNLYESFGFKSINPYRDNPIEGAIYMELDLNI